MAKKSTSLNEGYVLATGDHGAARLLLLQKIFGATTETWLQDAGLKAGLRVAEMGCGVGTVTQHFASRVGSTGEVVALDASPDQIAVAEKAVRSAGYANVRFVVGTATSTGLPSETFDLVYCRLLLCHLQDPVSALREFLRVLKPNGVLVCEDLDSESAHAVPTMDVYDRFRVLVRQLAKARGVDYAIGPRLPHLVLEAGFQTPSVRMIQPAYFVGEEKRWWDYTVLEAGPAMLECGLVDAAELEKLQRELDRVASDSTILVAQTAMTQILARRP